MARKPQDNPQLDMTPMIDVVFELIIFFVVTIKQEDTLSRLNANRPAPSAGAASSESDTTVTIEVGKGYDHCWVLDKGEMATGRKPRGLVLAAELSCPLNGRRVSVWTSEPCVQVYTANWASYDQTAKGGEHLSFRCGCALETQHAPDSPNRPKWPTTFVKPGERYSSTTEFRFSAK